LAAGINKINMTAAPGLKRARPRWWSTVGWTAAWLSVNGAAWCLAWQVANWRVPLPRRPAAREAVEAWTQRFDQHYHTFFLVYVTACIFILYLVGLALRWRLKDRKTRAGDFFTIH
jgi:hypothetical protein